MQIFKVISGGQNGVDQAGLFAAAICRIPTGGTAPKGYRTLDGSKPQLGTLYGLKEHFSGAYPARTFTNVRESDGTIRLFTVGGSSGEVCTKKAINEFGKPHFDVKLQDHPPVESVVKWILDNDIKILNVAGNSEQTSPGITVLAVRYLVLVFRSINQ